MGGRGDEHGKSKPPTFIREEPSLGLYVLLIGSTYSNFSEWQNGVAKDSVVKKTAYLSPLPNLG